MFNKEDDDVYAIEFWRTNSQDATGDGDSQRVFATVLNAIQEFLTTKAHPRFISFTGAKGEDDEGKDSRVSLYSKLLQRYATSWGYKLKNVVDRNDAVKFDLVKIKQDIEEVVNKELWHPERMFKQRVPIGDYEFEAIEKTGGMIDWDANALTINAYDPKKKNKIIGNADFVVKGRGSKRSLVSDYTYVDPKYRGEGIATMMYAYAKSLGNDIKGSNIQTPMGKKMWANWGQDAEHLKGTK
jgi:GNAT superfamily N-acetyltransferase